MPGNENLLRPRVRTREHVRAFEMPEEPLQGEGIKGRFLPMKTCRSLHSSRERAFPLT